MVLAASHQLGRLQENLLYISVDTRKPLIARCFRRFWGALYIYEKLSPFTILPCSIELSFKPKYIIISYNYPQPHTQLKFLVYFHIPSPRTARNAANNNT